MAKTGMDLELAFPVDRRQFEWKTWMKPLPWNAFHQPDWSASSSNSHLFRLSTELLQLIVDFMPYNELANLALVNSDWYRLVRPRQFRSISGVEPGSTFFDLAAMPALARNAYVEVSAASSIRYLYISDTFGRESSRHSFTLPPSAAKVLLELLPAAIGRLPSLEAFWYYKYFESDDTNLWVALSKSTVRHLHASDDVRFLDRNSIPGIVRTGRLTDCGEWPLRSFTMKTYGPIFDLGLDLLRASSQSVQKVTIVLDQRSKRIIVTRSFDSEDLVFPKLQDLSLSGPYEQDLLAFSKSLVSATKLRSLSINGSIAPRWDAEVSYIEDILTHLVKHGQSEVSALDLPHSALSVPDIRATLSTLQSVVQFEFSHSDCRHSFEYGDTAFYYRCFPAFSNLTKLSLELRAWTDMLLEDFRDIFNRVSGLKKLLLWSDGFANNDEIPQPPNHECLRECLSPLRSVTHLGISGDCIVAKHGHWYPTLHRQTEESHLARTLSEARKYMSEFPSLQWMYIGQYPMALSVADAPRILTSQRVRAHGHLSDMFQVDGWMAGLHEHSVDWHDWYVMGEVDEGLDDHDSEDTDEDADLMTPDSEDTDDDRELVVRDSEESLDIEDSDSIEESDQTREDEESDGGEESGDIGTFSE